MHLPERGMVPSLSDRSQLGAIVVASVFLLAGCSKSVDEDVAASDSGEENLGLRIREFRSDLVKVEALPLVGRVFPDQYERPCWKLPRVNRPYRAGTAFSLALFSFLRSNSGECL